MPPSFFKRLSVNIYLLSDDSYFLSPYSYYLLWLLHLKAMTTTIPAPPSLQSKTYQFELGLMMTTTTETRTPLTAWMKQLVQTCSDHHRRRHRRIYRSLTHPVERSRA